MKGTLETSTAEPVLQDKKNYATESADKSISANNSETYSRFALRKNYCSTFCLPVD